MEFLNYIGNFERDFQFSKPGEQCVLADFMENYSLMDDNDRTDEDDERDAPIMTTVHASKGLEFPIVFVVGMEQNLFPHERSLLEGGEEEERRLFYVAMTRARHHLVLSHARSRFRYGKTEFCAPSRYTLPRPGR